MNNTLTTLLIDNESTIRLTGFLLVLVIMMLWELKAQKRPLTASKPQRWLGNLSLIVVNSILVKIAIPIATTFVALYCAQHTLGLFNLLGAQQSALIFWLSAIASFLLLDMLIYWQHRVFHTTPLFWKLHQVHHADVDIDVTTGIRFHTIEILLSMLIKLAAIFILGAPVLAVIVFEVVLNAAAMFNHANIHLPAKVDAVLRRFIVTPDMHRVHHSDIPKEFNSNFGFNLSLWDRLFTSYVAQPKLGHQDMTIGLSYFRQPAYQSLIKLLAMPFLKKPN